MFKITEGDFKNKKYGTESYLSNWPMLYILENGKQAYIGQSNHVSTRMGEHLSNEEKKIFDKKFGRGGRNENEFTNHVFRSSKNRR